MAKNKEQLNTSKSYHASSSIALDSAAPAPDFFFFLFRFLFAAVSRIIWNGTGCGATKDSYTPCKLLWSELEVWFEQSLTGSY